MTIALLQVKTISHAEKTFRNFLFALQKILIFGVGSLIYDAIKDTYFNFLSGRTFEKLLYGKSLAVKQITYFKI